MIARIFSLVAAATFSDPFTTRETVAGATPAILATSFRVACDIGSSIRAQNLGRVGAQGAKYGRDCGNECGEQKGTRGQSDNIRVGCFDLVEKRLDIARCAESERDACKASDGDHQEDV